MDKKNIFIAILAGGKGERLWPKSRINFPKQNLKLLGKRPIVEDTVRRAKKIGPENIFIVTSKASLPYKKDELKKIGVKRVIVEPFGRDTAPAVGLAALLAFRENEDSVLLAMPSDAIIGNENKFLKTITKAIEAAERQDAIVTIGIRPTSAKSAYGYIGINERSSQIFARKAYKVTKFIEKPEPARAARLLANGRYFWNSGIFIFRTSVMLKVLKRHTPALYRGLMSLPDIKKKRSFETELEKLYKRIKAESLDCAVLEKSDSMHVIPSDFKWSDLGSFDSIAGLAKPDNEGNVVFGNYAGVDTEKCVVFSDTDRLVGTLGIKGIIIVATPDAILVCDRKKSEEIKKLVEKIRGKKRLAKFL